MIDAKFKVILGIFFLKISNVNISLKNTHIDFLYHK